MLVNTASTLNAMVDAHRKMVEAELVVERAQRRLTEAKRGDDERKKADEAEALADDAEVLERVPRSRLQVRMVKLQHKSHRDADYEEMCEQLIADIRRHGLRRVQEGKRIEKSFDEMRHGRLPGTWIADWCY